MPRMLTLLFLSACKARN